MPRPAPETPTPRKASSGRNQLIKLAAFLAVFILLFILLDG